jgi:hypothetical protein
MFIELTSRDEMEEWLPKLVGVEVAAVIRVGDTLVRCIPDPAYEAQLTREEITSSVHYVQFALEPAQVEAVADPAVDVAVGIDHPGYRFETVLGPESRQELLADLRG